MSKKLIYIISGITCIIFLFAGLYGKAKAQTKLLNDKNIVFESQVIENTAKMIASKILAKIDTDTKRTPETVVVKKSVSHKPSPKKISVNNKNLVLTYVSFKDLPGWDKANVQKSLLAFQTSCEMFLKKSPVDSIGTQDIKLKARDWYPACKAALELDSVSENSAKKFFEVWFHPVEFEQKNGPVSSVFTGYYMPKIKGSLKKEGKYNTPIYGLPNRKYLTLYTREQIDKGALRTKAPVVAWIQSPAERLFLEIEGSGVIELPDGKDLYLNYAGENGAPYTSIAQVLINKGILTRHKASKNAILHYLENHPEKAKKIIHANKSFVFFENVNRPAALGVQNMTLTPGYSLAVDKKWIPVGAPLWLDTTRPTIKQPKEKKLQRLMIAQDIGGAIRGFMRGDIFWGSGKFATFLGEHMKSKGHYWLLLPKHII
ncbi:membrane-bound lytic murein transglycosylase (MltA) family protein [Legionella busanensis]|uniref:Membrane-bound lytic murein transglycosylase A n=1 Tax=Legionella busanensis TaxID=190655 RepID=A0A378JLI3_9GAMM|nr:MltA domain-containing protein [Legionella busanensis]STX52085.1 membrane-bound lytic murein transglycosylase (MltA) family protein [Legionella busanensis]